MDADPLRRFSPLAATWFRDAFAEPTAAQAAAWDAIAEGRDTLVVAPTGSGKTLAAFLWALDRLAAEPPADPADTAARAVRLAAEGAGRRHRTQPAVAPGRHARRRRAGRHPAAADRRGDPLGRHAAKKTAAGSSKHPPDILITTPESLFLILTSQAREALRGVETVIVDEVHAVAGTKRGAHLALSLERVDELLGRRAQRIGLSATVRPHDEVARFLGGAGPVTIVAPPSEKTFDLSVVVPVEDMAEPGGSAGGGRHRRGTLQHLAGRRRAAGRADPRAPQHDRVRQLAPAGRAAVLEAERDRGRGDRARPPRIGQPRAAAADRGGPEGRPPPRRGGDQLARAGHRHGRRWTWSCRSSRRRRWRAGSSASAGPVTRSAR